jgi:hypothetical protein
MLKPAVMYGSETWSTIESNRDVGLLDRKILKINEPITDQGVLRV